ncbi:putative deoxyribonuclease tatdn1 [Phtheirospermum japonicum]|uniref:Putative deoxyribonuclease tatdn1 n=1 Tax=Phtheirospermum japonicum TaxID=374723 RepID=A0A830C949_9LAMI|nr:putative deoxyribonuclease tatdn1 [Phtheirospermum japonicum]
MFKGSSFNLNGGYYLLLHSLSAKSGANSLYTRTHAISQTNTASYRNIGQASSGNGMFRGMYNGKPHHVADIAAVLSRAWSAGIDRIIVTGGSLEESKEALAIAETDGCFIHSTLPLAVKAFEFDDSGDPEEHFKALLSLRVLRKAKYFEKQFNLAYATKLPMFLHMRAAAENFCNILEQNRHSEEELSVLPRHTRVVVTENNRTKSVLVGLQGVVKKFVGLGG